MFPNQRELRHGMITKISEKIQSAVLSVGRTKEDLKKYTLNIESTAWTNSKGNQVGAGVPGADAVRACSVGGLLDPLLLPLCVCHLSMPCGSPCTKQCLLLSLIHI